ncbi:F0F1 ATP synthase subunit B [Devriesea agamarum]|uniref:F0F1 ATP synthase subunit B n=1 Tax=Devriesea agamarum TaxID=472569 RepID=UPI00071D2CDF|nr:F0F1 ATP synthase subunit B [Devriesea agamarum]
MNLAVDGVGKFALFIPEVPEIFWTLVFLIILCLVCMKYVLPKMNAVLDERRERIESGLKQAEVVQDEVKRLRSHQEQELATARQQAAEIREKARQDGQRIVREMRERAESEAERIVASARQQIEAEHRAAAAQLRGDVGSLATDLASKIVGEALTDDERAHRVIDRFLDDLEAQADVSNSVSAR